MADDDEPEGMMSRWSKRKLAVVRAGPEPEQEPLSPDISTEETARRETELQANREAAEAVDLEALTDESDFSVFLKDGVPDLLRKQAMMILWRSNPVFANVDGLVDYDDDFGSPDLIMKTFKSAYQAGRGYLDLFKEDEEPAKTESDPGAVQPAEESPESNVLEEVDEKPVNDEPLVETVADHAENLTIDEEVLIDEAPKKVSLRKRLEL